MSLRMILIAAAALGLPASLARAGVVYVEQTRRVEAEALVLPDRPPEVSDSESAADFGPFNGDAFAEFVDMDDNDGGIGRARVTQNSRLEAAGITASGQLDVDALDEFGRGRSLVDVVFDVTDSPADFTLSYDLRGEQHPSAGLDPVGFRANILLERVDGGGTPVVGPLTIELQEGNFPVLEVADSHSGTLAPGRYHVTFDMRALPVTYSDLYDATYDFALALSPGNDGPGPNPIPLPPAAWAALSTMAGFGALKAVRRYRR